MNGILGPVVGIGGIGVILLISEFLWSTNIFKKAETPRKIVHILTGVYIAFWPLIMSFRWIQVLSVLLFAVVYASKRYYIFRSVHSVNRPTYGELMFPLGVLVSAAYAQSGWTYMAAVLHLSVADGLAALVGVRYMHAKKYRYHVFGQPKTYIGTAVFFITSLFIIATTILVDPAVYGENYILVMLLLPIVTTFIENIAVYGTDNLLVPVAVIAVLGSLRVVG